MKRNSILNKQARKFSTVMKSRQIARHDIAATMGNGVGILNVVGESSLVWVTIQGKPYKAYCSKVPPQNGKDIWVGRQIVNGKETGYYEVLSERAVSSAHAEIISRAGYAPASRYHWTGEDPLMLELRAYLPLRVGVSSLGGMMVDLYRGIVESDTARYVIDRQNVDISAHIPTTDGKSAFVLITIDDSGAVIQTAGSEVDIADLDIADIPMPPTGTVFESGAVRVYYGQTNVQEGRRKTSRNTDFVDLRFGRNVYAGGSGGVASVTGDSVDNTDPINPVINAVPYAQQTDTKDPTGWLNGSAIGVSYDATARTITLTGTLSYYWRGKKYSLTSPWTSSAHADTNGVWYLSSADGATFTWSNTAWSFDSVMVAFINYGASNKFAICETHGLMGWETHRELHFALGTYRSGGGVIGSYTVASTTADNRRPTITATTLEDEDNTTVNAALTSDLYTQIYYPQNDATNTLTYVVDAAEIVPVLSANPYYNAWDGAKWNQTLMSNNSYSSVWVIAVPVTDDAASQKYRYLFLEGQSNGTLLSQTSLSPSSVNLGSLATESPEFVFLAQVIIRYTGGNWTITSVTNLLGNRFIQVGTAGGSFLSSVTTDATLTGDGTIATPLTVVQNYSLLSSMSATNAALLVGGGATTLHTHAGIVVQSVISATGAVATSTVTTPADDTIPTSSEGAEFLSVSITPTSATNKLWIDVTWIGSSNAAELFVVALFQDAGASAIAVSPHQPGGVAYLSIIPLHFEMAAGTTSATTFKVRVGGNNAGTTTFNGISGGRFYGGKISSYIKVTEVKV